jgi:hypothetical protein
MSVLLKTGVSETSHIPVIKVDPAVDMDMKVSEKSVYNKMLTTFLLYKNVWGNFLKIR